MKWSSDVIYFIHKFAPMVDIVQRRSRWWNDREGWLRIEWLCQSVSSLLLPTVTLWLSYFFCPHTAAENQPADFQEMHPSAVLNLHEERWHHELNGDVLNDGRVSLLAHDAASFVGNKTELFSWIDGMAGAEYPRTNPMQKKDNDAHNESEAYSRETDGTKYSNLNAFILYPAMMVPVETLASAKYSMRCSYFELKWDKLARR